MTTPKINPERLPEVCRERASGYGDLRASSLTALALDQAADELDRLRGLLIRAQVNVPELYTTWHEDARKALNGEADV